MQSGHVELLNWNRGGIIGGGDRNGRRRNEGSEYQVAMESDGLLR